ncbi:flagellar filament capping protein FliD [Sulfuricurvum sp.]|uniref:flagellar filament capping protein FliD n=1 Tax=Sulfuricurvum sp. TaxID=2025608 RepID=UPI003C4B2437
MAGTINSLGLGSGVLTSDVIDKLKAADTASLITPIDGKITLQKQKDAALSLLGSLMTTFKSSVDAMGDSSLYQQRSVTGNNSSVSVTVNSGVATQSFSISNTQMALANVKESGTFSALTSTVATGSGTMGLTINGTTYDINYTAATTLSELKDAINSVAGSSVKASTLQVGTNDYRLVLTSVQTGVNQTISLTDSVGGSLDTKLLAYDAATNPTGMEEIQAARDASFKYNGITLTRSSNVISDITPGVTINLLGDNGSTNIAIVQDTQAIADAMSSFVQNYNSLTSQLTSMTTTDVEAGKVGIFNGDSSINLITREINQLVTSVDSKGLSLAQFGIDLSQEGTMSFNSSTFTSKFNENATLAENFFSGMTTVNANGSTTRVDGLFTSMTSLLDRYTGVKGMIETLTTSSSNELKTLNENKKSAQAMLNSRYEVMSARFARYDSLISRLNNQFSSLQQQISMAVNGTNN